MFMSSESGHELFHISQPEPGIAVGLPELPPIPIPTPVVSYEQKEDHKQQVEQVTQRLERIDKREHKLRTLAAGLFLAGGAVAAWGIASGEADNLIHFDKAMKFEEPLQRAVNHTDDVLAIVGLGAAVTAAAAISGVKLGANGYLGLKPKHKVQLRVMDQWSSREMSENKLNPHRTIRQRALEATFAGSIPVLPAIGVGLAAFGTAMGTTVANGPQVPVERALSTLQPGDGMLVGYSGAMPMVESDVSRDLANRVIERARNMGITARIFDQNLGQLTKGNQILSDLFIGIDVASTSPLYFGPNGNCAEIPISIDKTAGVPIGETVQVNGNRARVVAEVSGASATNRVGGFMDETAMAKCLKKSPDSPVHSVVFNASRAETLKLVEAINQNETAAVISKQRYLDNSKNFWESNVKPITSVLSLFAGLFAAGVSGGRMRESLVRNRREWASKIVSGNSYATLRATEILRTTKHGLLASVVGGVGAFLATPVIANTLVSGFRAGVGVKELAVGASVGIVGSIAGAAKHLIAPKNIIRPEESLRS
jgi:hypothetical protein